MSYFRVFSLTRKTYSIVKGIVSGDISIHESPRERYLESLTQDEKPGISMPLVKPKTVSGNNKPLRPDSKTSSGQTSKPFWVNGKPKCKKGFRYDFKRKLCVKIK